MSREKAILIASNDAWHEQFQPSRGRLTLCKRMRVARPGDELVKRIGQKAAPNKNGWKWWCIGSYSRPGGGGYVALRSDGKLVALEQCTNLDAERRKSEMGQMGQLVEECL